ncbi:peptidoglycan DD-metalloendopeptidase family protein [Sphingomonas sp.]|uniref:M23 family metallopeptidase n=1 Tax=Sphingomonas sp. TaxID=28214 RepID=UPI0025EA7C11|nr:peptidoglycan DD-metalloendopeptidase family protein [Sphingomonas sp.]
MCTPALRARLPVDPAAASINPASPQSRPPRNLGIALAAFPASATAPPQPPVGPSFQPALADDLSALRGPQRPVPPVAARPGGDDPLAVIMEGIRRDQMKQQGAPAPVAAPPPAPRTPVKAAPVRQARPVPVAQPKAAATAGTAPLLQRRWPVHGYGGASDGSTSRKGIKGPNGAEFYGDGRFDPTGAHRWRSGKPHMGVDLPQKPDTPVQAAADGVVSHIKPELGPLKHWTQDGHGNRVKVFNLVPKKDKAGNAVLDGNGKPVMVHQIGMTGYGKRIWIDHPDGTRTTYNHLRDSPALAVGAKVRGGQVIGLVGTSGNALRGGSHLHFEVQRYDRKRRIWVPIDPAGWINGTQ